MNKRFRTSSQDTLSEIPETQASSPKELLLEEESPIEEESKSKESPEHLGTLDHIRIIFEHILEYLPASSCTRNTTNTLASWLCMQESDDERFLTVAKYHEIRESIEYPVSFVETHNNAHSICIRCDNEAWIEFSERWNPDLGRYQHCLTIDYIVVVEERLRLIFTYDSTCTFQIDTRYMSRDTYTEFEDHILSFMKQVLEIQDPPYLKLSLIGCPADIKRRVVEDLFDVGVIPAGLVKWS